MAITDKLTLVVPTCKMDLMLLRRFLISVRNYFDADSLHEVVVIFNDHYKDIDECRQLLEQFDLNIRFLWSNELWPEQDQYDWFSQQQLKLVVANTVETEWYIIHDSKDFYTTHIGYADYIDNNGRSLQQVCDVAYKDSWLGVHGFHHDQYQNAYQLMGLDLNEYQYALRTWTASICPVHTQTVRDLVQHLQAQFGTLFPLLLLLQKNHRELFTEYALLSAWLHKNDLMAVQYQTPDEPRTGFHLKASSNKDLRRKKKDL